MYKLGIEYSELRVQSAASHPGTGSAGRHSCTATGQATRRLANIQDRYESLELLHFMMQYIRLLALISRAARIGAAAGNGSGKNPRCQIYVTAVLQAYFAPGSHIHCAIHRYFTTFV